MYPRGTAHPDAKNLAAATKKNVGRGLPIHEEVRPVLVEIMNRYDAVGATGMILDAAFSCELVATLYLDSIITAYRNDEDTLHSHVKTWGYLRSTASKHWDMVARYTDDTSTVDVDDYEEILRQREADANGR